MTEHNQRTRTGRAAARALETMDSPGSAVLTFSGLLLGVQSLLLFAQLRWSLFTVEELAGLEPALTFVVGLIWVPVKRWLLPFFMG